MATTDTTNGATGSYAASYHDTADRRLTRANIVLRRRMENGVGIWEAEIAGHVVSAPGGPVQVPAPIAHALLAPLRGGDLVQIARMRTSREDEHEALHYTLDPSGAPGKRATALEHVRAYLGEQLSEIERNDPVVRLDRDVEALHDLRVAVRRSRAVLRATRHLFEPEWLERLRDELRWFGGELGPARDLDVLLEHLRGEREAVGSEAAPVVKRIERERRSARKRAVAALDSERYLVLLDEFRVAVDHPPVRSVDVRLDRIAGKSFRKLQREMAGLADSPSDGALHRARIRAKRARYAAELAVPVASRSAERFVQASKRFQDVVGEHQDAIVAEERIRAYAESADAAFGAGRLVERQHARRVRARAELPKAWKRLRRRGRQAWS